MNFLDFSVRATHNPGRLSRHIVGRLMLLLAICLFTLQSQAQTASDSVVFETPVISMNVRTLWRDDTTLTVIDLDRFSSSSTVATACKELGITRSSSQRSLRIYKSDFGAGLKQVMELLQLAKMHDLTLRIEAVNEGNRCIVQGIEILR